MTEPPLFGSAAGSGPSPQGDAQGDTSTPPMTEATPSGPETNPLPLDPAPPLAGWTSSDPLDPLPGAPPAGPVGWTSWETPPAAPPPGPTPTVTPGWSAPPTYGAVPPGTSPVRGSRTAAVLVVLVVIALIAVGAIAAAAVIGPGKATTSPGPSGAAQASASSSPNVGVVVFSDDFHDQGSGWSTGTLPSGTTFTYTSRGFEIFAKGSLHHITSAPYGRARERLTVSTTATQSSPAPDGAGFGVTCDRGTGAAELRYEFIVATGDAWTIERLDGSLDSAGNSSVVLKQGALSSSPGSDPMTVQGTCITQSDGQTARLSLVVDGVAIAEITDTATLQPGSGWYAELIVVSEDPPTTVTVTRFEVRTVP
jgi:hypothetical protein